MIKSLVNKAIFCYDSLSFCHCGCHVEVVIVAMVATLKRGLLKIEKGSTKDT